MAVLACARVISCLFVCSSCFLNVYGAVFEPRTSSTSPGPVITSTETEKNKVDDNIGLESDDNATVVGNNTESMTQAGIVTPKLNGSVKMLDSIVKPSMTSTQIPTKYKLPDKWTPFCHVVFDEYYESIFTPKTNLVSIKCRVTIEYSNIWSMVDLREDLKRYENTSTVFSVEIICDFKSSIAVLWPFKVYNLFKLVVRQCIIADLLADQNGYSKKAMPQDSLRVLEIKDTDILISVARLFQSMTRSAEEVNKDYECGHEKTIEHLSMRNVSYNFIHTKEPLNITLTELGETHVRETAEIQHKCLFKRLMTLDEARSESRSIYHMDLLSDNAVYSELRTFNLSYNHLKVLTDDQLHWSLRFAKLETLDLSHNDISKLYRFKIPLHTSLDRITTINLQYNNISMIPVNDLEQFKKMPMVFIDLRNNGLNCNCSDSLGKLIKYVASGRHLNISNLSDYSYIENLQCSSPKHLFGKTLKSLTEEMICGPSVHKEYFLVPILCISAVVVLLAVSFFIGLRYRQEITILLFTRFNIIIPCQTRENCENNKEYDAFVSYSSNEEEEVERIFEDLENRVDGMSRQDFKFCMHHRDFIAGKTIFDNVTRAVENSRHTIILLSNHFLQSEYCLYEFQEAFRQSIMEKRRHLVIVMMEDIPEDKLPRDLRRCVKTFTYIRRNDHLFIERLVYAMSVKQKNKVVKLSKNVSRNTNQANKISSLTNESSHAKNFSNIDTNKNTGKKDNVIIPPMNFNQLSTYSANEDFGIKMPPIIDDLELNTTLSEFDNTRIYRKLSKSGNGKLDVNIKQISDINLSPVERKILQKATDYDRSVSLISQDTGYGSDLASLGDRPSPEVGDDFDRFLHASRSIEC